MKSPADLVRELDELANTPACSNLAAPLNQLARDLRTGESRRWANVEILRVLDPDEVVVERSTGVRRQLALLDFGRTLVLFLPLLFTWGGIFFAVRAYRGLLNASPEEQAKFQDASFLQMWTEGFGHRTWVTLDVVAIADFIAITAVVILFGFGGLLQRRADRADNTVRRSIVRRLRSIAAESALAVSEHAEHRPDPVLRELRDLAPALQEAVRSLVVEQQEFVASVEVGRTSSVALTTATGGLATAAEAITGRVGDLAEHLESVGATAHRFDNTTRSLVKVMHDVTEQLPLIRSQLQDHLQVAERFTDRMGLLHDQHQQSLAGIVPLYEQTLQRLGEAQSAMVATVAVGKQNVTDLARATGDMASAGSAVAGSADGLRSNIASITAATGTFETTVQSLLTGAADMNVRLPSLTQDILDVMVAVRGVGGKLDRLYERQEVIAQELGVIADVPLAAAQAAKRTAEVAAATESALLQTLLRLPEEMEKLRDGMISALDQELAERRAAAGAVSGASDAARQMVSSAEHVMRQQVELSGQVVRQFEHDLQATAAGLVQSSQEAAATLAQAIDRLRDAPSHVLPDLHDAYRQLAENLERSRRLVHSLSAPGRRDGPPPPPSQQHRGWRSWLRPRRPSE